jgi:hypothetical protein
MGQQVDDRACAVCEFKVEPKKSCKQKQKESLKDPNPMLTPATEDEKMLIGRRMSDGSYSEDEPIERTPDGAPPPEYPNWSIQAWMYKEALLRWKRAGYPTRTQEEVEQIHKEHCTKCSWYDAEKKRCKGCGCKVTDGAVAVVNKIKMATEHCPREIW